MKKNAKSEAKRPISAHRANWVQRVFQPHFRFFNFLHFPGRQLRPFVFIFASSSLDRVDNLAFSNVSIFPDFPRRFGADFPTNFLWRCLLRSSPFGCWRKFNSLTAYINTPYKLSVYSLKFSRFKVLMLCFLDSELWRNERLCYGDSLIQEIRRIQNSRSKLYISYGLLYLWRV